MQILWPPKDPDEKLDYRLDWTKPLRGDKIANSVWTISANSGLVVTANAYSNTVSTIWLANGSVSKTARITNVITTQAGRIFSQTVSLQIAQK